MADRPDTDRACPDCGVLIGSWHVPGCDVARCQDPEHDCHQLLLTGCQDNPAARDWWDGHWPGVIQCQQLGWWADMTVPARDGRPAGVVRTEDLNRLAIQRPNDMRIRTVTKPAETF